MDKYRIRVELLTEAVFGSGKSVPGVVDLEIVHDEYGLPFMKGKTFKGNFREAMEDIINLIGVEKYGGLMENLLGKENNGLNTWSCIKFSDCMLPENIRNLLAYEVRKGKLSESEIKEALTDIRSFTSIEDDGSYREGSLRNIRVLKKGLVFYVDLDVYRSLSEDELGLMATTYRYLRHIGTMRNRGKREVKCSFLVFEDGIYKDMTDFYMNRFLEGVK